jgi:hypothetical protein
MELVAPQKFSEIGIPNFTPLYLWIDADDDVKVITLRRETGVHRSNWSFMQNFGMEVSLEGHSCKA